MLDLMGCQRIYIGGLTPDIKDADVLARFKPFGKVASCEIVRGKDHTGDPAACRGFAYVTIVPKDEAALARVFSLVRTLWHCAAAVDDTPTDMCTDNAPACLAVV